MLIAVIAANGRSGSEFVKLALLNEHNVRAGVHKESSSRLEHPKLTTVRCDATKLEDVINLTKGCDAILSFIGHARNSPNDIQTQCIEHCIAAAKKNRIDRIISLTGTGVRFPGDKITPMDQLLNISIGIIDPKRVRDGINHVRVLEQSELNWTVLRVLKLTSGKAQKYSLKKSGPTRVFTSRKTVALAALSVLENRAFMKQAPIISKKIRS